MNIACILTNIYSICLESFCWEKQSAELSGISVTWHVAENSSKVTETLCSDYSGRWSYIIPSRFRF